MNSFITELCKTMGIRSPQKLNCCCCQGTLIDSSKVSFSVNLPDGTRIEIYTPTLNSGPADTGYAYLPDYDVESPDMCSEDLGCWVDESLDCCRRIDAYYASCAGRVTDLNSALSDDLSMRIKDVFRAAQSAVDLPPGFRYTAFRENKGANLILSTLMYTSAKLGTTQWVAKSSLTVDPAVEGGAVDDWAFEPNYNPDSEGHLIYHRQGRFIDIEQGMYGFTADGDTPDKRDRKAAYWLAGLLSDMVDSMLQNPPARCYEYFLADGIADLKKSDIDRMSKPGVLRLVQKGYVDPEKVLKAKPELAKDLVEKKLITPEIVARRVPDKLLWLVQKGLISPDYAVKLNPELKNTLTKRGLYEVSEGLTGTPEEIIEGVRSGSIQPIDAYRANPKLLQPLVEQSLITPQEAYKLDASIVTWLLLEGYIGRAEATKVKPDIQKYIARKYKDVDWDSLDASLNSSLNDADDSTVDLGSEGGMVTVEGELTEDTLKQALARAIAADPDTPVADVRCDSIQAFVSPAGYKDNQLISDGNFADAAVYVTLYKDYTIIKSEDGRMEKKMPGRDVVKYIKSAANRKDLETALEDDVDLDSSWDDDEPGDETWEFVKSKEIRDWDGWLTEYSWYRNSDGLNVFVYGDSDVYRPEDGEWDWETESDAEAQEWFENYTGADEDLDSSKKQEVALRCSKSSASRFKKSFQRRKRRSLNSSLSLNSAGTESAEEPAPAETPDLPEEAEEPVSEYGLGYEKLQDTKAQGPAYVAECMLPEDDFDGIIVPGESEDIAKETLMQMLLANDGTFIDWKPIEDIQIFKTENSDGNYLVLN